MGEENEKIWEGKGKNGGWGKGKVFPEPIKIYDSKGSWGDNRKGEGEGGCFVPKLWAYWSNEYECRERDPENTTLAPWVKGRW